MISRAIAYMTSLTGLGGHVVRWKMYGFPIVVLCLSLSLVVSELQGLIERKSRYFSVDDPFRIYANSDVGIGHLRSDNRR